MDTELVGDARRRAAAFKALGDPNRLAMLTLLAQGEEALCVCDLGEHLPLAQPTVSHHLKILVEAGLVRRRQEGRWAYYSIVPERMAELQLCLGDFCTDR
jgi:ArsR family transcriptional regulator